MTILTEYIAVGDAKAPPINHVAIAMIRALPTVLITFAFIG